MTFPEIAAELRGERRRRRWSQRDLAGQLRICQSRISDLERCAVTPSIDTLIRWAAALGRQIQVAPDLTTPARLTTNTAAGTWAR